MVSPLLTPPVSGLKDIAIRSDVLSGIRRASLSTGVDFSYLMAQANRESSFDPSAQAKSSSAAGLYQFVEQTWLGVVKNHGAEYGQGQLASKIVRNADGHFSVADHALRTKILDLRRDPAFASAMAAEHAADNKAKLEEKLGREINGTDLYMAHFLGISGAIKFLRNLADSPDRTGAGLFPKAAAANSNVFYAEGGRARTVAEIYDRFSKSMNADMEAYAAFERPGEPATGTTGVADAGTSLPPSPNAAYALAFRGATTDGVAGTIASATPEPSRLGGIGSLLSPLMLVTLAALPVGRDENSSERGEGQERASRNSPLAPGNSLFGISGDPLHLELLRSSYAT